MGWGRYGDWGGFRPYVPVARKLANAAKAAAQYAKKQGREPSPVKLDGKKIASTFWGKAWCDNLEAYSDFSNRLPRGATYVRNGSVVDLVIKPRSIEALVAGSETYKIKIAIDALAKPVWKKIKQDCSASIDSLLDLLAGRFSEGVMQRLTRQKDGLFPAPREIKMECSCPDWSDCCKHLAAVMYGIAARLDKQPELLFLLRDVDHQELVTQAVAEGNLDKELSAGDAIQLAGQDLGAMFGIELDTNPATSPGPTSPARKRPAAVVRAEKSTTKPDSKINAKPNAKAIRQQPAKSQTVGQEPDATPAKSTKPLIVKPTAAKRSATAKKSRSIPKKLIVALAAENPAPKRAAKKSA